MSSWNGRRTSRAQKLPTLQSVNMCEDLSLIALHDSYEIPISAKIPRSYGPPPFQKGAIGGFLRITAAHFHARCCTDWYMNYSVAIAKCASNYAGFSIPH